MVEAFWETEARQELDPEIGQWFGATQYVTVQPADWPEGPREPGKRLWLLGRLVPPSGGFSPSRPCDWLLVLRNPGVD